MVDDPRYDDRPYPDPRSDRRSRPGGGDDYGQFDYGGGYGASPRRDEDPRRAPRDHYGPDEHRAFAPYGTSGPVRTGRTVFDGDGHPAEYDRGGDERGRRRQDHGHNPGPPNVRGGRGLEARTWWDRAGDTLSSWLGDDDAQRRHRWDELRHAESQWPEARGDHRGRGPKGYRRSDARIAEDVNDRLTDDPFLDASSIAVLVQDCEVTLSGAIVRREDKRRAEVLAESVSGVTHVQNNLRLTPADGEPHPVQDPAIGPNF